MIDYSLTIKKAIENDQQAWKELYEETYKSVYFTAYNMVKTREDILEVIQNTYITAFSNLNQLKEPLYFNTWIKKIMVNKCKDILKIKKPNLFQRNEEEESILNNTKKQYEELSSEGYIIKGKEEKEIISIINALPENKKMIGFLFYYDELTIDEIAKVMECSESTVVRWIDYVEEHIKREIERLKQGDDRIYSDISCSSIKKLLDDESKIDTFSSHDFKLAWEQIICTLHKNTMDNLQTKDYTCGQNIISKLVEKFNKLNKRKRYVIVGSISIAMVIALVTTLVLKINSDKLKQAKTKSVSKSVVSNSNIKSKSTKSKLGILVNKAYDDAGYFRDGVCPVNIHGKWGVIDKKGNLVVKPQWDYMNLCSEDGYLMVGNYLGEVEIYGGSYVECGFIDIKGNTIIPMKKSIVDVSIVPMINAEYIGNDIFCIYVQDRGDIYYDKNGKEVKPVKSKYKPKLEYSAIKEKNGDEYEYGITDQHGNTIIEPQYSMAFSIGNGFFAVNEGGLARETMQGGTWKIINEKNENIIELGEDAFRYENDRRGYGWGESFPMHTQVGTFIIGEVKEEETETQNLMNKYLNSNIVDFESITASSTLASQASSNYNPKNIYDYNSLTTWSEGVSGNGEGEWIEFIRSTTTTINTIFISNGYCKNNSTYYKNSRVKELKFTFSDGTDQVVKLPDSMYEYIVVNLPKAVKTSSVKCTILSVYPGENEQDTCINEILFFGNSSANIEDGSAETTNKTSKSDISRSKEESTSQMNGAHNMYAEYYKILKERIDQYGILPIYEYKGDNSSIELLQSTGVGYAMLLDFDGDGVEELFICYNSKESKSSKYIDADSPCVYEVWGYKNSVKLLTKEEPTVFGGGNSLGGNLYLYRTDKNIYVVNFIRQRESDEEGIITYQHYIYGTINNNKWMKKVLKNNSRDDTTLPWENQQPIVTFDELEYTTADKEKLMSLLQRLKKYSE